MRTDPVCHMQVEPERAAAQTEHKGTTYYFCSHGCRDKFVADPEKYAGTAAPLAGHGAGSEQHG